MCFLSTPLVVHEGHGVGLVAHLDVAGLVVVVGVSTGAAAADAAVAARRLAMGNRATSRWMGLSLAGRGGGEEPVAPFDVVALE